MNKKKATILSVLFGLSACLSGAMLMSGCDNGNSGGENQIGKLVNFTDSSVSVEIGDRYLPDITAVKNEEGKVFQLNETLFITAADSAGKEVPITDGAFTVNDFAGYTVFYRVYQGVSYQERKVSVSVTDATAPEITVYGWRSEREVGTFALPQFYVSDNSGENLEVSYKIVDAQTGKEGAGVTVSEKMVSFSEPGVYKLVAEATDSKGNKGVEEKEIVITPSMGANVWENFDNQRHLEVIKNNNHYTSQTTYKWLESFNGESGVAMIKPNYKERWFHSAYIQLGLNKTYEEMLACKWDYFTVRAYITAGDESTVTVANGTYTFGNYKTGEWVDIEISRKQYLSEKNGNVLSGFTGSEGMTERYDAFSKSVIGDTPALFLSVNTAKHESDVTIYIDEITWGSIGDDVTPPEITLQGVIWKVASNSTMKIPTIVVSDDRDPVKTYESAKFYYQVNENERREIAIKNGVVEIGGAGKYLLVVKATDFSGNTSEKEFVFTALDDYDPKVIATYDNGDEIGGVNGELSWMNEFEGAAGVMKTVVDNAVEYGAGFLQMKFAQEAIDAAIASRFDYIRIRLYVSAQTASEKIGFYSWNRLLGEVQLNTWADFDITIKDLSNGSFLSYDNQFTRQDTYNKFLHEYVYNMNNMMYTNDVELINKRAAVTFYIDSIVWGVTYGEDYIESVPGLKSSFDSSQAGGNSFAVPAVANVSDGITTTEKSLTEFKIYAKGTQTEVVPVDGVYTFADGEYTCVAKVTGCKDFTMDFVVENLANTVYNFSEKEYYTKAPVGVHYPSIGQQVQFNYHNGGSEWLATYTGADGKTEYGVQKANTAQSVLRFDIGCEKFEFDYIVVRIYFATSATSIRMSSHYSHVALGLKTNQWIDVTISRESIQTAGSALYVNGGNKAGLTDDSVFYSDIFGIIGYNNQNAFCFNLYDQNDQLSETVVYISRISYGLNQTEEGGAQASAAQLMDCDLLPAYDRRNGLEK